MASFPEVLFVLAAQNDGRPVSQGRMGVPLSSNHIAPNLMVVASAMGEKLSSFSNYGAPQVTHAARGVHVMTTAQRGASHASPDADFDFRMGTSFSTPAAARMMAEALLLDPGLTPIQLKMMATDATTAVEKLLPLIGSGGLIQEDRVLQLAALTGLVRRGTCPPEAAARLRRLLRAEPAELLALVPSYA